MSYSVLAVIPVRSGSKRLPGKNVAELGGKPLLAHTIEQVESSSEIDTGAVSTEDEEFQKVAREHGGNVPFDRPEELATDDATNKEVVEHAINWYNNERDTEFDAVCILQVTSPFRTAEDIDGAVSKLRESDADSVVSTTEYDTPPFWAVDTDEDGYLRPYFGDEYLWSKTQTQSVPELRHPNGAIYAVEVETFLETMNFYTDRTVGYRMPRKRSLDIDEPFDMEMARALYERRRQ